VVSSWSKILRQGNDDLADNQVLRVAENADCNTFFCFTIPFFCYSCCILTVVHRFNILCGIGFETSLIRE